MPKQKNVEVYQKVAREAHRLFLQKGYVSTSYQDIASASGVQKNLVQYYFPQKSMLAVSFFETVLKKITCALEEREISYENPYQNMFLIGSLHFSFLFSNSYTKKMSFDIIRERDLTETMLFFDFDWGMSFLGIEENGKSSRLYDEVIYAMGGFYELFYSYLSRGQEFDFAPYLKRVVVLLMEHGGISKKEAKRLLDEVSIDEDICSAICADLFAEMSGAKE